MQFSGGLMAGNRRNCRRASGLENQERWPTFTRIFGVYYNDQIFYTKSLGLNYMISWIFLTYFTPIPWYQLGSEQKRPGANRPPEFVPESPLQKGVFGSHIFS